jgi:hypothetical protein
MRFTLDEWLMDLKDGQKETTACNEGTETKLNPGLMQFREEHQDILKGEATVMLVGEPRKRRRVCNLATECRQKRNESTQGNCGSRRKSSAACRKVSPHAKVAWHKRNIMKKISTLEKCGWRKEFTDARIRTNCCAKVAWHKERSHEGPLVEKGRRKKQTRNKFTSGT